MLEIFKEPFMRIVLVGAVITGVTCSYLGVFMILKRIVFMGIALSQAAALGVAIGLFAGISPVAASLVMTLAAIVIFWIPFSEKDISGESLLGFAYAFFAALAVILVAKNPLAEARGLNLISGNLLYMGMSDLITIGAAAAAVFALHLVFFKQFIFVSFDRETAHAAGIKANLFDFILYLTIGVTISLSMMAAGVIFVFSSLVIPAMTAVFLMRSVWKIFFMSAIIAVVGVVTGLVVSYVWDLPSGPAITGAYGALFFLLSGTKILVGAVARS